MTDHLAFASTPADADPSRATIRNELLRRVPVDDFRALVPHLRRVTLAPGDTVATAGAPVTSVYFLEAGVVGLAAALDNGGKVAVGLVGREGLVGWSLVLGNDRWPHDALVRAETSTAIMVEAGPLGALLADRPALRALLLRYVGSVTAQMAQTIVSNLIHSVEARTARWLLLYHDRLACDELALTHEELGVMLGVRRSSITDALHQLEGHGAVRGLRGRIVVRDRQRLEALATLAYGAAEADYARLVRGLV